MERKDYSRKEKENDEAELSKSPHYINRKGGTRSKDLCKLSLVLWDYCLLHNILLRAVYFRGSDNTRANDLSRNFQDNHDYYLSSHWFQKLHSHLDSCLEIDLFASRLHHHLPTYSSLSTLF